jgi:hypothetical protein
MTKSIFFSLLIFLVTPAFLVAQNLLNDSQDLIEWNEYYSLTWEDFQGTPDKQAIGDAGTAVQIKAKPFYVKDQVQYDVEALFNRKKSWSRGKSESLLQHEQLHFDIAELYARKIRKKINDMEEKGVNDIREYNAAIRDLLEQSNEADQRYDLETLHGALSKKQAVWETKVKEQLIGLKDYKKKKRVITVGEGLRRNPLIFG